jgi:hypothetical protein
MPVQLLSAAERDRANRVPSAITDEDLITFFTLSEEDRKQIPVHAGPMRASGLPWSSARCASWGLCRRISRVPRQTP